MSQPPLRARLHRYKLTTAEFALLTAMCEHCSSGETIWASIQRLSAYSKLSERQVQRIIQELLRRHVLRLLAPPNRAKCRPATYAINEAALQDDPAVMRYVARENQYALPGMRLSAVPRDQMTPCHQPLATSRRAPGDTMSPDSKAFDPTAKEDVIHHGDAALNALPAWIAVKDELRSHLSPEEWNLWVRPMYLQTILSGKQLLAALPPNGRVIQAAQNKLPLLRELLAPAGYSISLTRYPDEWEIQQAKERYGKEMAPKPWTRGGSA